MVTRREFIQASALLGGVAIGGNSFSPLRAPGKDSAAINPTVTTALGKLRGAHVNGVYSFKGIQYGASTAGPLRFQPPVPPKPLDRCYATRSRWDRQPHRFWITADSGVACLDRGDLSEDCLVLNVWTPDLRGRGKRPVMVWLHGGNFGVGSGARLSTMEPIWLRSTMSWF